MIITIDGQAGSGKSTAAARLADALGYGRLNTGAMYRASACLLARAGVDLAAPPDGPRLFALMEPLHFEFDGERVFVCGEELTHAIPSEEMGAAASRVGGFLEVRRKLQREQRRLAEGRNLVCEGRDQGTVVFPEAPAKFYFTASAEHRARRRASQLGFEATPEVVADLADAIRARDRADAARELDPLRVPEGAAVIDTSELGIDAVLSLMLAEARAKVGA